MGKGDIPRSVDKKVYDKNFKDIFGSSKMDKKKELETKRKQKEE